MSDFSWGTRYVTWYQAVKIMKRVKRFHEEGFYLLIDEEQKHVKVTLMGPSLSLSSKDELEITKLKKQQEVLGARIDELNIKHLNRYANKNRISS